VAWFWWPPAVLLLIFLLFLIIPVSLEVRFLYRREENYLALQIKIWPGNKYRKIIPRIIGKTQAAPLKELPLPAKKAPLKEKLSRWRRLFKAALPSLLFLLRRTKLHRVRWHTKVGLSDAYSTALAAGFLWGAKGFLLSALYRLSSPFCLPDLVIVPDFRQPSFAVVFAATISVRPVYILLTGIKAGYLYLTSWSAA